MWHSICTIFPSSTAIYQIGDASVMVAPEGVHRPPRQADQLDAVDTVDTFVRLHNGFSCMECRLQLLVKATNSCLAE